jgi:hypothetical protein
MPRRAPRARCPDPLHQGSHVFAKGTVTQKSGTVRRYRCEPLTGRAHYFTVGVSGGRRLRGQRGAPECPDHPGSKVVRNGFYGRAAAPRQRYRCDHTGRCNATCRTACDRDHDGRPHAWTCPKACGGRHNFTPMLPRQHVEPGDRCDDCLELRGIHRGEMAVARRQRFPARVVARVLEALSTGLSYSKAGALALDLLPRGHGRRPRKSPSTPPKPRVRTSTRKRERRSPSSRLANRRWHIGADITEAFAPVVWAETERRLRLRAEQMARQGDVLVWILDEKPVHATDEAGKRKKTDGWSLHVLAELDWTDTDVPGRTRLRLVRALPKSTSTAWRLLFDEVGYRPDIIVSDGGTPILAAVDAHFRGDPDPPLYVPSVWHIKQALRKNSYARAMKGPNAAAIASHLDHLHRDAALFSPEAWAQWWDVLRALGGDLVVPSDFDQTRNNYFERMARAIPRLATDDRLKISTGGLESVLQDVERVLVRRAFQYGNVERTNHLMDLVVAQNNGMLTDHAAVVRLIEADEMPYRGWTVPMRTIEDPQPRNSRYSSLRDESLMRAVAAARGLL